ncbi:dephospho-CoA kinase [Bifidobacterium sp. ESL0790]|uniref:dephospho-CoA kinase n=1 Tax=Bifidobacterium sp. ESL0790 TaxID=2983233 RepID=UPI0023FA3471|nr:dephospho-CoA kinase [Bifidobacterium sp. ESL0790]WEV73038.1 dephospho-CoA kinase [Bifidobacterium sp. ESL0790]
MRIGLTGGIAAGKSTVAAHLKDLGAFLIDYDQLAREVVESGGEGIRRIAEEFGPEAVEAGGSLDRAWMAAHVFSPQAAPDARRRLDDIEHPLIYRRAQELEEQIVEDNEGASSRLDDERLAKSGTIDTADTAHITDSTNATNSIDNIENSDIVHPCSAGTFSLSHVIVHDVPLLAEVIDTIPFSFDHILTVEAPEEVRIQRMIETRGMSREQAEGRICHQSSREQREAIADVVVDSTQSIEQMFERLDKLFAQWR